MHSVAVLGPGKQKGAPDEAPLLFNGSVWFLGSADYGGGDGDGQAQEEKEHRDETVEGAFEAREVDERHDTHLSV